jgi:hypothetical protein
MPMRLELQVRAALVVVLLSGTSAVGRDADDAGFASPSLLIIEANDEASVSVSSFVSEFDTQSYGSSEYGYPLAQSLLLQVPVPTAKPVIRPSVSKVKRPAVVTRKDAGVRAKRVSFSAGPSRGKLFLPLPIIVGLYR